MATDFEFSDELIIHLIEWMTHYSMVCLRDTLHPIDKKTKKQISHFFESEKWGEHDAMAFHECYMFLEATGIIRRVPNIDYIQYEANCQFSNIRETASNNFQELRGFRSKEYPTEEVDKNYIFLIFSAYIADHLAGLFTKSESERFSVEPYWDDMFTCFIQQGLVRKIDDLHFWTKKARTILEETGVWKVVIANDVLSINEKIMIKLSPSVKDKLYYLAAKNQKILAVSVLKEATRESLGVSKSFLENFMFPTIWGAEQTVLPDIITWKYYL